MDDFISGDAACAYQPGGACKMRSGHDEMALFNNPLQVHGIENLRTIDAAVMPSITSANINAITNMLAERASDMLLG